MNNAQLPGQKFQLYESEMLRIHGYVVQVRGRVSIVEGHGYLTTRRFVFCRKPRVPFGSILGQFFRGRKIVFAFPLEDLISITHEKHGLGRKHVFRLRNTAEHSVQFGPRRDAWLLAFGAAIRQIRPGIAPRQRKEFIEFA
ncbi:MAG: hypothetical protein ACLQDV_21700 [Candidatus Binataceae bacterium]